MLGCCSWVHNRAFVPNHVTCGLSQANECLHPVTQRSFYQISLLAYLYVCSLVYIGVSVWISLFICRYFGLIMLACVCCHVCKLISALLYLGLCARTYRYTHVYVRISFVCLSVFLLACLYVCLWVCLYICRYICACTRTPVRLSLCLSVCM